MGDISSNNINIISMIWGIVSFFISFNIVRGIYPIFTILLNLNDGLVKTILTIGVYLTVFAIVFLIPYGMILNREDKTNLS